MYEKKKVFLYRRNPQHLYLWRNKDDLWPIFSQSSVRLRVVNAFEHVQLFRRKRLLPHCINYAYTISACNVMWWRNVGDWNFEVSILFFFFFAVYLGDEPPGRWSLWWWSASNKWRTTGIWPTPFWLSSIRCVSSSWLVCFSPTDRSGWTADVFAFDFPTCERKTEYYTVLLKNDTSE